MVIPSAGISTERHIARTSVFDGERVLKLRQELKMTQEEFAKKVGVNLFAINRWEHDKARPNKAAQKVMRRLERQLRQGKISPIHDEWTPERIRTLRTELELTQEEFADLVGVALRTVQAWEHVQTKIRKTTQSTLQRLERKLRKMKAI